MISVGKKRRDDMVDMKDRKYERRKEGRKGKEGNNEEGRKKGGR